MAGTHLPTNLTALGALGVDVIDLGGTANVSATIDDATAATMIAAGLHFAAADNITLSVAGTHLPTSLSTLHALHVDQVSNIETGISIDVENALAAATSALAPTGTIETDAATGIHVPADVDEGFATLFRLLSEGALADQPISIENPITVDDSVAAVLAEAGMLEILAATALVLDATASGKVVDTSLAQMANLGVDQVQLAAADEAPVYVDLGVVSDDVTGAQLLALFQALDGDHDRSTPLFVGATNVALVVDEGGAQLIRDTSGAAQAISDLGITEIAVVGASDMSDMAIDGASITVRLIGDDEDPFNPLGHLAGSSN